MSRRVKPSWGLLFPHFGKRLNNCDNGLIKSTSVAEGLATFSPTSCFKLISQRRELHRFSSFYVTPDRPSVDEHFQLEAGQLVPNSDVCLQISLSSPSASSASFSTPK